MTSDLMAYIKMTQNTRDGSNNLSDSYYNMPNELLDADDIEKYDKILGGLFVLDPNAGYNKNMSTKDTVKEA